MVSSVASDNYGHVSGVSLVAIIYSFSLGTVVTQASVV